MANTKPHSELEKTRENIVVIVLLSTTFVSQKNQGLKTVGFLTALVS